MGIMGIILATADIVILIMEIITVIMGIIVQITMVIMEIIMESIMIFMGIFMATIHIVYIYHGNYHDNFSLWYLVAGCLEVRL